MNNELGEELEILRASDNTIIGYKPQKYIQKI